jgi:hypothetical protein
MLVSSEHREEYYTGIISDPDLHVKLSGSWETLVGEQDTSCKRTTLLLLSLLPVSSSFFRSSHPGI